MSDIDTIDPVTLIHPFATDLWLPRYRGGQWGPWTMQIIQVAGVRGYWGEVYPIAGVPVLTGPTTDGQATWMSIVPVELESQEIGIAAAHGHTVVMGMGMGWCAANVALNPAVDRVTVVERDPDVLALLAELGILDQLPAVARDKIAIVQADAFDWRPDGVIDSLQIDIWPDITAPTRWADVERLQAGVGATSLYFWGQEMELWRLACRAGDRVPDTLDRGTLDDIVAATGLPLVMAEDGDLADRIVAGARWWTPRQDGWWRN